jgi:hypothetical protein
VMVAVTATERSIETSTVRKKTTGISARIRALEATAGKEEGRRRRQRRRRRPRRPGLIPKLPTRLFRSFQVTS